MKDVPMNDKSSINVNSVFYGAVHVADNNKYCIKYDPSTSETYAITEDGVYFSEFVSKQWEDNSLKESMLKDINVYKSRNL